MEAESLNIKIRLDLSTVSNGVKKVKDQFNGMKKTIKDSLPQISKEGDKAEKSLNSVDKATDKLKNSLSDVGTKAKTSLGQVYSESEKVANKLKNIKFDTNFDSDSISEGAGAASDSLGELQSTMQSIRNLDFASLMANNFDKIKEKVSGLFKPLKDGLESAHTWNTMGSFDKIKSSIKDLGKAIKSTFTRNIKEAKQHVKDFGTKFKDVFKGIGGFVRDATQAVKQLIGTLVSLTAKTAIALAGITALVGANIANNTKQYREEQSKLVSAFQAAGASAEEASQAYNGLFRFLGDSGRAVEAANHLAKITTNTQNLAEWTTIAQGVYATFGDSLPVEGLTEAANESLRVSKVTGVLADAFNWAGVSEDAMNAALEKTTSLEEREVLLRQTLNGLYQNAAHIYELNNKRIIEQNEAQARLDATMARIGQQTQVLVTSWINLKNVVMTVLAPAIIYISAVFSVLIDKLAAAIKWLGALIGIDFKADQIGGIVSGVGGVNTGISNATNATDGLTDSLDKANAAAQKLKRTTMGFDELNIVSNPNTASSSGGAGTGAGAGGIGGGDIAGLQTGNGIFPTLGKQIEDVKAKVEAFFDKWKTQIGIIGAALAALGIAGLLGHLGKAIGLGDKFLKTMSVIKKLASAVITIVLQYTLVNEFMDNYINGEGFKEYIKGLLVSALGTWVLYSLLNSTGLVIGLGVTAVASIKAVIDNGGIDSVESAVVALTGLAAAIGAIAKAADLLKKAGIFTKITSIGKSIAGAMGPIGKFIGSLSAGPILLIAGIIAAIASAAYFLYENWDKVTSAVKRFFDSNIVPKIDEIKESLGKMGEALGKLIPPGLKTLLKDIGDAIADIAKSIGDWFASIDWLKGLGKAFEGFGGIIFSVVSGVIAGAIEAFIGLIQGAVDFVSGIVQIISGVIRAIVNLFTGDLQEAGEACQDIADGIFTTFEGMYNATIGVVKNFVKGVIDWFIDLWDELVGHSIVPDMVKAIIEWFEKLPGKCLEIIKKMVTSVIDKFKSMFSDARTALMNGWNSIKKYFNENIASKFTKSYWQNKFDSIRAGASDKINAVKTAFSNGWNNIKKWFNTSISPKFTVKFWKDKFNSIKDGAKSALNGVIDVVEKAINGIIKKINTLSWKIPDWVPKFGGDTFGFSFKEIKIPRLAQGGIATRSTLANIGESGREAVLPLDQNTEWMDMLANKIAARNNTPTKVVLNVDGKELGWAAINNINGITKQTGQLQLVYV